MSSPYPFQTNCTNSTNTFNTTNTLLNKSLYRSPYKPLNVSGGAPRASAVGHTPTITSSLPSDEQRKKLIASLDTNTYALNGKNFNISWDLKTLTKEEFKKALTENTVHYMGFTKGIFASYNVKVTESQSYTKFVNGMAVSSSSSTTTNEKIESGQTVHILVFARASNINERIELLIGSRVEVSKANTQSGDSKSNADSNRNADDSNKSADDSKSNDSLTSLSSSSGSDSSLRSSSTSIVNSSPSTYSIKNSYSIKSS